MPRKSKKSTEPEAAASAAAEARNSLEITAIPPGESDLPAKKPARKPRAKKAAAIVIESEQVEIPKPATSVTSGSAEAEATAQAADTFDDAFESNDGREAQSAKPEVEQAIEKPKKAAKAKRAKGKAEKPVPEPEPPVEPEVGPDEDDELAGDWESGSDSDEDEDEQEQQKALPEPKLERLQKILAAAGIASRRHAEELITEGRVQVNGKVVTELGSKADAARDHIRVDGKLLHGAERLRYFMLNKPRGYVTTVSDPEGRATVMEFFSKLGERLYPVGRLDYLSEGLLLMTNDGELANKLTRAASGVEKTYLVKVSGQPDAEMIEALREGVRIDKGRPGEGRVRTAPARIQQVRVGDNPWFEVTLIEGRNRELRKMFEEIGHHVEKIRRVGYGPLVLDLEPGQSRELDEEELRLLRLAAEGKWKPKRVKGSGFLPKEAGRSVDHDAPKRRGRPFRDNRRPEGRSGFGQRQDRGRGGERPYSGQRRDDHGARPYAGQNREDRGQRPYAGQRRDDRGERPGFGGDREGRREGGGQDRPQDRGAFRGQGGGARFEKRDRGYGDRPPRREFGSRPQGSRPFPVKPQFDSERSREGSAEAPRGQQRFGNRPPSQGSGDNRQGQQSFGSRPPRPGRFGKEEGRGFRPREERPAEERRGEQRFGARPARPSGGGFRPQRQEEDRRGGGSRGFVPREGGQRGAGKPGGFGQRGGAPRRDEGGGQQRPGARGGSGGGRGGENARPAWGRGGGSGGGNRGGGFGGVRGNNRPKSGPRGNQGRSDRRGR